MRSIKLICMMGCVALSCGLAKADPPQPQTPMPQVEISNQSLETILGKIREQIPGFHFAVFRSADTPADYPKLPAMSVNGITVEQFLELIKREYPDVKIDSIPGDKEPLYSVRIDDSGVRGQKETAIKLDYYKAELDVKQAELDRKKSLQKAGAASQTEVEEADLAVRLAQSQESLAMLEAKRSATDPVRLGADLKLANETVVVKIFRIDDLLANTNNPDPKKAMDDVLSLVQAALDETGNDAKNPAVLKVHQPTRTLIFKGSPGKAAVLEQVLDTLRPKVDKRVAELRDQLDEQVRKSNALESAVEQSRMEYDVQRKQTHDLEIQLLAAKAELGQAKGQLNALDASADLKTKDARLREMMEKIEALKKKMQDEDSKSPQFAKDRLAINQLIQAYVGTEHESPATQLSK